MHGVLRKSVVLLGSSLAFLGCKGEEDQSPSVVSPPGAIRCVQGVQRAVKATTAKEVSAIYYAECAELFSQTACRDAWRAAAGVPANLQVPGIADACRKAYCPTYSAFSFDICRKDFAASPDTLLKAWPPLFDAILAREAGPAQSLVTTSMLVVYARLKQLEAAAPPASDAPPAPSGVPAPPSSASAGAHAAAPASSAGTPASAVSATAAPASSARAGAVVKETKAPAKPASSR